MRVEDFRGIHVFISLILFMACLAFPGFYSGDTTQPWMPTHLLKIGWLGPLDGKVSWYGNLFYLMAIFFLAKPRVSAVLGVVALGLTLSFLLHDKIMVSEAPTYDPITAYGLGYVLWVASIGVFAVGQVANVTIKASGIALAVPAAWLILASSAYACYFYCGDNSLYALNSEREKFFTAACRDAGQHIYKKVSDVKGVFFDPDWSVGIGKRSSGGWYVSETGVISLGYLSAGYLEFYEKRPWVKPGEAARYVRYTRGSPKGETVHSLMSRYAVVREEELSIPKKYGILAAEIVVKDLRDGSIVASTKYALDRSSHRFCGYAPDGYFSTRGFVETALNLSK